MEYQLDQAIEILERTPKVMKNLLLGLSEDWTHRNEGKDTWSPYDVIGHLVHGEKTDWMPRLEIVLSDSEIRTFTPYDRFAQFEMSKGKSSERKSQHTALQKSFRKRFNPNSNSSFLRNHYVKKHVSSLGRA